MIKLNEFNTDEIIFSDEESDDESEEERDEAESENEVMEDE